LGDGDDDQNHEELGPVASSTSDATVRDVEDLRTPCRFDSGADLVRRGCDRRLERRRRSSE
jgi:hypothetical protein